ncbi:MAG: SDR family oxidoreductase [Acidimicrobiia bacterium]
MDDPGDVIVVTGAASGMDRACAHRFAGRAELVLVDLDPDAVAAVAAATGGQPFAADVTDAARVAELAAFVASTGPLHALVHAAGISPVMAERARILEVDLRGTALLLDAFDRLQRLDHSPLDDPALAYGWAKRAVVRLVRRAAPSWGARGARIVSLSPGVIDTPMAAREEAVGPMIAQLMETTPLHREGTADELAAVVDFLCSTDASYITGVDIVVDGGTTAGLASGV